MYGRKYDRNKRIRGKKSESRRERNVERNIQK
jgi:hypothetical protein